jgi:sodium/potassium-transporting ATPase subunit alpha
MIPFNSAIKFNLIIRDMNPAVRNPQRTEDNLTIFLKGAPEKVLKRVSYIKIQDDNGNIRDVAYDAGAQYETEAANDRFGLMGERVLAFARLDLDPINTPYNKTYQFDTKQWANWDMQPDMRPAGWFPMTGLTLVGLISLNDPPRPKVDVSVQKCRDAGV